MGVHTFVCCSSGDEWSVKTHAGEGKSSAATTYDLRRQLVNVIAAIDSSGRVSSAFSLVTNIFAVFQVIIGGGIRGGAFIGGGGASVGGAAGSGGAKAPEAPPAEEKNDDMGFSLFKRFQFLFEFTH